MSFVFFIFVVILKGMCICKTGTFGNETLCLCLYFVNGIFTFKTQTFEHKPLAYVNVAVEGM